MNERNVVIDIAKGIAVLCMIAGHTFSYSKYPVLCSMIFIWNMPLFFIFSGYFYNTSKFCISINVKALLKPYISTGIIIIAICFLKSIVTGDILLKTLYEVKAVLWGWGAKSILHGNYPIPNDFPTVGPIWFLLALLWCKLIYYGIVRISILLKMDQWIHLIVCIVSFGALCVSYYYSLPFSILQGLHAVLYFHIGHCLHNSEVKSPLLGGGIFKYFYLCHKHSCWRNFSCYQLLSIHMVKYSRCFSWDLVNLQNIFYNRKERNVLLFGQIGTN